jgi:hypothetical protein
MLPHLLRKAHNEASKRQEPLNLYTGDLNDWTAGYFFNSGLFRIACGLDYTLATVGKTHKYDLANFQNICETLEPHNPTLEVKMLLDIVKTLQSYGRKKLDQAVDRAVKSLVEHAQVALPENPEAMYQQLRENDQSFIKTGLLFVWNDYHWFKHRPIGYSGADHPRVLALIQYALALRAYRGVCVLYSWCRGLGE